METDNRFMIPYTPYQSSAHTLPRQNIAVQHPAYFWLVCGVILFVGLTLRLWHVGEPNLWTDELLTELRAQKPFHASLDSMLLAGNQAPLYYFMLRILPTNTEFLLRLPSVLMGVIGIGLLIVVALQVTRRYTDALWAGLLLAVSPFHVMLSRTARAYSLLFVLALLSFYFFYMLLRGRRNNAAWAGFAASTTLAYVTHYTAVLMAPAQLLVMWLAHRQNKRTRMFRPWFIAQAVAAIPFGLWCLLLLTTFDKTNSSWFVQPEITSVPVSIWNLLFGYYGEFHPLILPALIASSIGLAVGGWTAIHDHRDNHDQTGLYWIALIGLLVALALLISWFITPAYKDRYFMAFLPGVILLFIAGVFSLPERYRVGLLAIVALTGFVNTMLILINGDEERADWEGAAATISINYKPGDTLLFERWNTSAVFAKYYSGTSAALANDYLLVETEAAQQLDENSGRIWAIYRNPIEDFHRTGRMPTFDPFEESPSPMNEWLLARRDRIQRMIVLKGVTIFLIGDEELLSIPSVT